MGILIAFGDLSTQKNEPQIRDSLLVFKERLYKPLLNQNFSDSACSTIEKLYFC